VIDPTFDTFSYQAYANGYVNTSTAMQWYWRHSAAKRCRRPRASSLPRGLHRTRACRLPSSSPPDWTCYTARARRMRSGYVPVIHPITPDHGFVTIMPFAAGAAARELLWADMRRLLAVVVEESA
jgi:acetyl esterase